MLVKCSVCLWLVAMAMATGVQKARSHQINVNATSCNAATLLQQLKLDKHNSNMAKLTHTDTHIRKQSHTHIRT